MKGFTVKHVTRILAFFRSPMLNVCLYIDVPCDSSCNIVLFVADIVLNHDVFLLTTRLIGLNSRCMA